MSKKKDEKRKVCVLVKISKWGEKVVYRGTVRGAERRIPPSKEKQFRIEVVS